MGAIVEWQSLKTQEYRYRLLVAIARFWELFGVRRPVRFEPPVAAGEYDELMNGDFSHGRSYLDPYIDSSGDTPGSGKSTPDGTQGPDQPPAS